jgi:hypothetical protein
VITGFGETYVMPIRDASGALITTGTIPTSWTITCDSGLSSGTPMSLIEYEEVNAGTTTNILTMTGATALAANASYRNLTADPFGDISATVTLTPGPAEDGDVLRIECWSGNYPGLTKLAEVRVVFAKLTRVLSDDGTAGNAQVRGTTSASQALDGRLVARVLRGTTGINGVPLLLRSENTLAAAVDKYVFANVSHTTGVFACPSPQNDQRSLVTSTTGPGAGSAQVDVYWQCDGGTINTPEAGVFRVYWDANQDGLPGSDIYVEVQQGSGTPIN